jgi:hypothetical protein
MRPFGNGVKWKMATQERETNTKVCLFDKLSARRRNRAKKQVMPTDLVLRATHCAFSHVNTRPEVDIRTVSCHSG